MGNNKSLTSIDENIWNNWSPISHQYVDDLWRVPTYITNTNCTLFVGDKMKRTFEKSLTPEFVKIKLTMIYARSDPITYDNDIEVGFTDVYNYEPVNEIGWQVSPSWYCLCLDKLELAKLRGEL